MSLGIVVEHRHRLAPFETATFFDTIHALPNNSVQRGPYEKRIKNHFGVIFHTLRNVLRSNRRILLYDEPKPGSLQYGNVEDSWFLVHDCSV